jgi:putative chitinase
MITLTQFKTLFPSAIVELYEPLITAMFENEIIGKLRECHFLAQCAHESMGFTDVEENFNYSARQLYTRFNKYFPTVDDAIKYVRKPQAIANKIYANRMGNRDEASGDGWQFRGEGLFQLTGKDMHTAYARWQGLKYPDKCGVLLPDLRHPWHAAYSAVWYWNQKKLSDLADINKIDEITYRINGTRDPLKNGIEERQKFFNKLMAFYN